MNSVKRIITIIIAAGMLAVTSFTGTALAADAQDVSIKVAQDDLLDIVLTLGETTTDVSTFQADLTAALKGLGVPESKIQIKAIDTNAVSAGNTSEGWETYDHVTTGWSFTDPSTGLAVPKPVGNTVSPYRHIWVYNGGQKIIFYGYDSPEYKDFMYMPNTSPTKKTFSFTMNDANINNHSMLGGGFIFNANITGGAYQQVGSISSLGEEQSIVSPASLSSQYISGYALLLIKSGSASYPALYSFNNVNMAAFHGSNAMTLVKAETTKVLSGIHNITIEVSGSNFKMTDTVGSTTNTMEYNGLVDTGSYGFGPVAQYAGHGCDWLSWFNFENLQMQTTSVKKFSEVIREPQWRDESKRFVINAQDGAVSDFSDPKALGEILSRLGNESIYYLGWGKDGDDANAFIQKNDNRGTFVDKDVTTTYAAQIQALADYIYDVYSKNIKNDTEYLIYGKPSSLSITPESEKTNTADADWPGGKWSVIQTQVYDNPTGTVPYNKTSLSNLDISFTEAGKYDIYYKYVAGGTNTPVKTVYVHRKPVASFDVSVDGGYNVTITDNAYDPDRQSSSDKGIKYETWQYRETTSEVWTEGKPASFAAGKNYVIKQVVTDEYGVQSDPYIRFVSTETPSAGSPSTPVAEFQAAPGRLLTYQGQTKVSYRDTSYDPTGLNITGRTWTVTKDNATIYGPSAEPLKDFSAADAGTYKITLKVTNSAGTESAVVARYLTVVKDTTKPTATCNTSSGSYNGRQTVTLTFGDEVGGSGFSHRFAVVDSSAAEPSDWGSMGTNNVCSVEINRLGANYIHYMVVDYAKNIAIGTFGPFTLSDTSAPVAPVITASPGYTDEAWSNCDVRFTASGAKDDFTADGDIVYEVSSDGVTFTSGASVLTASGQGTYTYYFRVTDGSGHSTTVTKTFKEDRLAPSAPAISMQSGGSPYIGGTWATDKVKMTLSGSTDSDSGLDRYQYKIDNGEWQDGDSHTFTSSGVYTLYYRAADKAGNVTETKSKTISVDLEAPEAFEVAASATAIDTISVSAATTDAQSGIAGYRVYNGTSWSDWKPTLNELLSGYSRGQNVTISVEAKDNAGNVRSADAKATTPQNSVPEAVSDAITLKEDAGKTVLAILLNDKDADTGHADGETLSVTGVSALSKDSAGTLALEGGTVYFTPAADFNGAASFNYTLQDAHGAGATGFATLMITPVNDAPSAVGDSVTTDEDKDVVIDALSNDSDIDSTIAIKSIGGASKGTVSKSGNSIKYTPAKDFNGSDSFTYTVTDGQYDASATVRVTVKAVDDTPVAAPDNANAYYMESVTIEALANDTDIDGDTLKVTNVSSPQNGKASVNGGKIVYTPAEGFTGTDTFTYTVSDGTAEVSAGVTVTVSYPEFYNNKTTAVFNLGGMFVNNGIGAGSNNGTGTGSGSQGAGGSETGSGPAQGEAAVSGELTVVSQPTSGTVSMAGGSAYYTPAAGTTGIDTYRVTIDTGNNNVEYQVVTNTDAETGETTTVGYGVPLSDEDFSAENGEVRIDLAEYLGENYDENAVITIEGQPVNGSVEIHDGVLVYRPAGGFTGLDAVVFTMKAGDEQVPFTAAFSVEGTKFSLWCVAGWAVSALLLALNYMKHRPYFSETRRRTIVYIVGSMVLLVMLCWARIYAGFLVTGLAALLYVGAWYAYGEYMQRRRRARSDAF